MGSGLVKCFVTHQSIPENMPVVVFPIIQCSGYRHVEIVDRSGKTTEVPAPNNTTVYSNCLYELQGVRFTCIADDYAQNQIENTLENKYGFIVMLNYLLKNSYKTNEGENSSHEKAFDMAKLLKKHKIVLGSEKVNKNKQKHFESFPPNHEPLLKSLTQKKMNAIYEELLEFGEKNRIYVANFSRDTATVFKFAICLKSVYDYAVQQEPKIYESRGIKKIISEYMQVALDPKDKYYSKDAHMLKYRVAENFSKSNGESSTHDYHEVIYAVLDQMPKKLTQKHIPEILAKLNFVVDLLSFQRYLNHLEVPILPITGYHQDYQNDSGNDYLKLVEATNLKVKEFLKEKYGEDDEDMEGEA